MSRAEVTGPQALESLKKLNEILGRINGLSNHVGEGPDEPVVFKTVAEHLPALCEVFESNEKKLELTPEGVDHAGDNYAVVQRTAKKCQPLLQYIQRLFEAVNGNPNKTESYRNAVRTGQGVKLETAMVKILEAALKVAEPPFIDESKTKTLQDAVDEFKDLHPSYEESCNGATYVTNNGEGTQSFHSGKGNINACERGMQIIGDTQNATYNPGA